MGCERCKRRDELDYCNLDDREKHFLMFMVDGRGHEMIIPDAFLKRFRGEIPREIKLETRNGHIYTVGVAQYQDKLVLRAGWEAFVETYDLQIDDSVVFRYNGNSQFNVIVFDRFGREKASSVVADSAPMSPYVQERHMGAPETLVRSHGHSHPPEMQSPTENMNISQGHPRLMRAQPHTYNVSPSQGQLPSDNMRHSEGHPQPIQVQFPSENVDHFVDESQHMKMQPPTEILNHSNCHPQSLQVQLTCAERQSNLQTNKSNQGNKSVASSSGDSLCSEDTEVCDTSRYVLGWNTRLNPVQKKKVDQEVQHIQSDNPIFVTMMSKCNVTGAFTLSVSKQYVKRFVGDMERNICLQRLGKRWAVQFGGRPGEKRIVFGWRKFVKDNDVEMGDICIFEMLKNSKMCTMEVHIIHAKDIDTSSKLCRQSHRGAVKMMAHSRSLPQLKEMQLRNETVEDALVHTGPVQIQPPSLERRIRLRRVKSSQGGKKDSLSSEDIDHEEGVLPYYILARFTRLTSVQKKAVKEKVQFIDSETPIFVAMMQQTNVTGRFTLSISKKYLNKYLGDEVRSIFLERLGEKCQVRLGCRPQDKRIVGGWAKFVKDNEVEVGDICLFELLKHRKLCAMKVHIIPAKDVS